MTPTGNGEPDPLEPARQTTHQVHPLVKQCDDDGLIIASQEEDDMVLASMGMNPSAPGTTRPGAVLAEILALQSNNASTYRSAWSSPQVSSVYNQMSAKSSRAPGVKR
jgi:hypothetical protein